jgi:hypothetical protein
MIILPNLWLSLILLVKVVREGSHMSVVLIRMGGLRRIVVLGIAMIVNLIQMSIIKGY